MNIDKKITKKKFIISNQPENNLFSIPFHDSLIQFFSNDSKLEILTLVLTQLNTALVRKLIYHMIIFYG